ncbi:hypothetical protein KPH14_008341 [Odynerus spinipes]|uniref:Uncharacterized protein n=1 Tax=Odynerus spinipes TaxID=1348599 RepID=A0AAD9R867_9HYME|nr:hypothetical protein KPH14_008341 [Odynerus spinipes]
MFWWHPLQTVAISNVIESTKIAETVENVNSVTSTLDFIFHNLQVPNNGNSELQIYLQDPSSKFHSLLRKDLFLLIGTSTTTFNLTQNDLFSSHQTI